MWDLTLVLSAIILWMVSLFLVDEAAKSQRWVFGGSGGIPNPYSGVFMSQLISLGFILFWVFRTVLLTQPSLDDPVRILTQIVLRPGALAPGFLIASFPPLLVGLIKLVTVLVVSRGAEGDEVDHRNRRWVSCVFVILHLATGGAALLILMRYFA